MTSIRIRDKPFRIHTTSLNRAGLWDLLLDSDGQRDDESEGHHDGRNPQLSSTVPAVHAVQLRQEEFHATHSLLRISGIKYTCFYLQYVQNCF